MIPKIIHYCWVGGAPKPQSVLYCIESWKKHCPDYEIKEWNETNYDFTKNTYLKQAYEAKKWGFVPDFARLDIVYEHGGIYLDTDVEIIKSLDILLDNDAFMGFENTGDGEFFVNCGHGFGAVKNHPIILKARDAYRNVSFINSDGSLNMLPSPAYTTATLKEFGLIAENRDQRLKGMTVFASDVLCPKEFRTGTLTLTERSVSIHHFTATWMDKRIKAQLEHEQRLQKSFGIKISRFILLAESVFSKYSLKGIFTELPMRVLKKIKQRLIAVWELSPYFLKLFTASFFKCRGNDLSLLDTSLNSDNCGDSIITENCILHLKDCTDITCAHRIPTHRSITEPEKALLMASRLKLLCGTNILSGHMRSYGLWKLSAEVAPYKNTLLMGVGFDSSSPSSDLYSRKLFKTILCKSGIHSVRDSFSEHMLKSMGIKNVINTGCPTMWNLTPELCAAIPQNKADNVVCTVTDYNRDLPADSAMLKILLECYSKVYLWLQGKDDADYVKQLGIENRVILIPGTLEAYDEILKQKNLDYIGTRLHAGIRALSMGHRSIIISIDNRAEEISADTQLPVIKRAVVSSVLRDKIQSGFKTEIKLPTENIKIWKNQFTKGKTRI